MGGTTDMANYPSIKRMQNFLTIEEDCAKRIRALMEGKRDPKDYASVRLSTAGWVGSKIEMIMEAINVELDGDGVERILSSTNGMVRYSLLCYVSRGDTYNNTILYDYGRESYSVQSWGDWVEKAERRGIKVE